MNLIEQLGGYEKAKAELKDKKWRKDNLRGSSEFTWHIEQHIKLLETVLLQYRRQHNIFEVGDKVVLAQFSSLDTVHEIRRIENLTPHIKGSETTYFLENSLGCWSFQIKHADDAEIQAGRRP